jgi:hypothetical protein
MISSSSMLSVVHDLDLLAQAAVFQSTKPTRERPQSSVGSYLIVKEHRARTFLTVDIE